MINYIGIEENDWFFLYLLFVYIIEWVYIFGLLIIGGVLIVFLEFFDIFIEDVKMYCLILFIFVFCLWILF